MEEQNGLSIFEFPKEGFMTRNYVNFLLRIAGALYFTINGVMVIRKVENNEFVVFSRFIFGEGDINPVLIFLVVCLFAGSVWLLLPLFKIDIPIFDKILLYQSFGWVFYIAGYDIIIPILNKVNLLVCLSSLSVHLMVLGIMFASVKNIKSIFGSKKNVT